MSRHEIICFIGVGFFIFTANAGLWDTLPPFLNKEDFKEAAQKFSDRMDKISTILEDFIADSHDIKFDLYTRENEENSYQLEIGNYTKLEESFFDQSKNTKVIIHGWQDHTSTGWVKNMRNLYLDNGDYNVIVVDWDSISWKEYFTAANLSLMVGHTTGKFIDFLTSENESNREKFHLVGHSLGAQIAGCAGSYLNGTIGRITGLDPAQPGFEIPSLIEESQRIDASDAKFVDIIRTCSGFLPDQTGHADFYPNGKGCMQPGCSFLGAVICSHIRSYFYMTESIKQPNAFLATKCDSWDKYITGECKNTEIAVMGEGLSRKKRGKYFLQTNSQEPFGKGFVTYQIRICKKSVK